MTGKLERKIAKRFEELADSSWFSAELPENDFFQLRAVREVVAPRAGMRKLDAGCARGRFLNALAPSGASLIGPDLTETFVRDARKDRPAFRAFSRVERSSRFICCAGP